MWNKDILQFSSEDLNQSMSPLKISYHYISSVTVSSSNRHPVCAGCMLPRHVLLGHLDPWRQDWLVILKWWNGIIILCCAQSQKTAALKTCSISVCPSIRRMPNGIFRVFHYLWTLLQVISQVLVFKKVHINMCPILDGYGVMTAWNLQQKVKIIDNK